MARANAQRPEDVKEEHNAADDAERAAAAANIVGPEEADPLAKALSSKLDEVMEQGLLDRHFIAGSEAAESEAISEDEEIEQQATGIGAVEKEQQEQEGLGSSSDKAEKDAKQTTEVTEE